MSALTPSSVTVSTPVTAPIDRVWSLISDVELLPRFSDELLSATWVDDTRGLGARFSGTNAHPLMGQWTTHCQVYRYRPPTTFGWSVGDPSAPAAYWHFDISPTLAGWLLSQTAELGPGRSGVTMLIDREPHRAQEIIGGRLAQFRTGMLTTVNGIKDLAEAAP